MLMLLGLFAAAGASCSDTCTHPGFKAIKLTVGDTVQDCSGYGPGLATPATINECKEAMLTTEQVTEADMINYQANVPQVDKKFDLCLYNTRWLWIGYGEDLKIISDGFATQFCKCSACTGSGTALGFGSGSGS